MKSAEVTVKVPFHDVDVMEVAWHGHYVKYFEIARCALLDSIHYNYAEMKESGYAWPVVDLHIKYLKPSAFGQEIKVKASLAEWENRIKIEYEIHDAAGLRLTSGHTIQVAIDMKKQELCFVSPEILFKKLGLPKP
jgi:acyl-CoA thioester hydrolase